MQILFKHSFLKRSFVIQLYNLLFSEKNIRFTFGCLLITCALFFLPTYHYIQVQATILPTRIQYVRTEVPGKVEAIFVQNGQRVYPNQVLFNLGNPQIVQQHQVALTDFELAKIELAKVSESLEWEEHSKTPEIGKTLEVVDFKLSISENTRNKLAVKSTLEGIVLGNNLNRFVGQYVFPGMPLFEIADLSQFKLLIPLDNEDTGLVNEGSPLRGTLISSGESFSSKITLSPQKKLALNELRPAYLRIFGGLIPIPQSLYQQDINPANDSSFYPLYIAEAPIPITFHYLHEGMRARVLIQGKPTCLGLKLWYSFLQFTGLY